MKKIAALFLALILACCSAALAAPSKEGQDYNIPKDPTGALDPVPSKVTETAIGSKGGSGYNISTEEPDIDAPSPGGDQDGGKAPAASAFFFTVAKDEESKAWAYAELARLKEAGDACAYFGLADEIAAILGEGEYHVFEFEPVIAGHYNQDMGEITAKFPFATPYEKGAKAAVMLGFAARAENGDTVMKWQAVEGAAPEYGCIAFKVDPVTMLRVQEEGALLAVVSK